MKYTKTFRNAILRKVLPPEKRSVSSVAKENGVAIVTINSWLAKVKNGSIDLESEEDGPAGGRNMNEKFNLLLEYQKVLQENQGEWLRQNGLHTEHLSLFKQEISDTMANKSDNKDAKIKELEKKLKAAEKEINRKNDALAEMAALMMLKKSSTRNITGFQTGTKDRRSGKAGNPRFCKPVCDFGNRAAFRND